MIEAMKHCESPSCAEGDGGSPASLTGRQRKYCSAKCRNREYARRKSGHVASITPHPTLKTRRGDVYAEIASRGWEERLINGTLSIRAAADMMQVDESAVRDSLRAILQDRQYADEASAWTMDHQYLRMLGPAQAPDRTSEEYQSFLDEMVDAFVDFREEFFLLADYTQYLTDPFHRRWIRQILDTIYTGGHSLIMSPPRHGKSDLLTHFCVWLICRNPHIRIAWVGGNKEIAQDMVGSVREHLADNEHLIEAMLSPGTKFKPPRSGEWKMGKFTVANRVIPGIKASSMVAVGRGGKILSRDMDFVICDDIEDHDSTLIESSRQTTRSWFLQDLYSRKEEHTGVAVIGSRVHHDDLYGYLINYPEFDVIVDTAHSEVCVKDPTDHKLHVDCMLFPSLRSYDWLMTKKRAAEALGMPQSYEMVYLNRPRASESMVFVKEEIEGCFDPTRTIGVPLVEMINEEGDTVPAPLRLVAGLDPSFSGYQAAFCWAFDPTTDRQWMVDLDNHLGGGIIPAFNIIKEWLDLYGVRHWVIEDNLYHTAIRDDPRIVEYCRQNDIFLEGHQTLMNKHDPFFGLTAMRRLFYEKLVNLPTGDETSRAKTMLYEQQLLAYSDEIRKQRRNKSDVLMGSWFPQRAIRRWQKETQASMSVEYDEDFAGWEGSFDELNESPW